MTVRLHPQALIDEEDARNFIQDQGFPSDGFNLLRSHINAVTAMMLSITGRTRLKWIDDDTITEYRDGDGSTELWLHDAPVRRVVAVEIGPFSSSGSTVFTGPVEPALFNDDMWFDPIEGLLTMKSNVFPDGNKTAKITYEAGYYAQDQPETDDEADPEFLQLQMIALDAVASKWQRFKNQRHGISSESKGETTVTYSTEDFTQNVLKDLRRYRRTMFV